MIPKLRTGQASQTPLVATLLVLAAVVAGCGSTRKASVPAQGSTQSQPPTRPAATQTGPSALQSEAASAATGDVPDNQVYVRFTDASAGYSIKYPEGWAQSGRGQSVTFRDKNNIVRVVVSTGPQATIATVERDLATLRQSVQSLRAGRPKKVTISGAPAIKVVYTTLGAPNAVTNKRLLLTVDRYYLSHAGKRAVVDLGTPVGVDNVDAYRLMIESLRWK